MRIERLCWQTADESAALDLDADVSVVEGVVALERRDFVAGVVQSLRAGVDGCHVEVSLDDGTPIAVFRPHNARSRAVTIDPPRDVSLRYQRDSGIDLLAGCSATDLELVELMSVTGHLGPVGAAVGCDCDTHPTEAPKQSELVAQQDRLTQLAQRHRRVRAATLTLGPALPLGALVGFGQLGMTRSLGLVGVSLALSTGCWASDKHHRHVKRSVDQLSDNLDASYLSASSATDAVAAVAKNLKDRLVAIRSITGGESLPLFLEDSVIRHHRIAWAEFRGMLDNLSGEAQVILFANPA